MKRREILAYFQVIKNYKDSREENLHLKKSKYSENDLLGCVRTSPHAEIWNMLYL